MARFRTDAGSVKQWYAGKHRFEHWYRDNTMYLITATCREHFPALASEEAKAIFWDRFDHYAEAHGFVPCVSTVLRTHYHSVGYLKVGEELGEMMRKLHGSVAKLVNDILPTRYFPFWKGKGGRDYFDGCLRNELQLRRAYRYTLTQCRRHGICRDPKDYPHTHVNVDLDRTLKRARELKAFMEGVPYPRYDNRKS